MVVWTKESECRYAHGAPLCDVNDASASTMRGLIELGVEIMNVAFEVSGVDTEVRLVHAYRHPTYNESIQPGRQIQHLINPRDGELDDVHDLRALYGADLVTMVANLKGKCGAAPVGPNRASSLFSTLRYSCVKSGIAMAHEIGHNVSFTSPKTITDVLTSSLSWERNTTVEPRMLATIYPTTTMDTETQKPSFTRYE